MNTKPLCVRVSVLFAFAHDTPSAQVLCLTLCVSFASLFCELKAVQPDTDVWVGSGSHHERVCV